MIVCEPRQLEVTVILHNQLEIIMVSYHRPRDLQRSVSSFLEHTTVPLRLTIIDNSTGSLNQDLAVLAEFPPVQIIKNERNLGKGSSFHRHYHTIMQSSSSDRFISSDADVVVGPKWYERLQRAADLVHLGVLAPTFRNFWGDTQTRMHCAGTDTKLVVPRMYQNLRTAGCLFIIDRSFYEAAGGYPAGRMYGGDDSYLCRKAAEMGRFAGFTTAVEMVHSNLDSCAGYEAWKREQVKSAGTSGFWD